MASIIWNRDPQEAINNPYEYNAQNQFHREAMTLTKRLSDKLLDNKKYTLSDRTLEKATWMLQTDALFAFRDGVQLIEQKKHRVTSRLLRDILDSVHLIEYFNSSTSKSIKALNDWFDDKLIMHSEYREFVKQRDGELTATTKKNAHRILSRFTHRSYRSLLYGYSLNPEETISYDEYWTIPSSVSMHYAFLGHFGCFIIENLKHFGDLSKEEVENAWNDSMEPKQIPRGYLTKEQKKFLGIDDDWQNELDIDDD